MQELDDSAELATLAALGWMAPDHRAPPAQALPRLRAICTLCPDLFDAVLLAVATHRGLPRELLAQALKPMRRELDALSIEDVTGLLTAAWNGGRQGFDAVLRTRARGERRGAAAAMPWATTDD